MQLLLDELSQVLAEEYRHYEALFSAAQAEQNSLVANDTDGVDRSLGEIRGVLARVQSLAERRHLVMCRISEQTGVPAEQLTLERLGQMSRGMAGLRLERLQKDFTELTGRLNKLNGTNLLLIRNALDMNDRTVRLILGETGQVHFYGDAGQPQGSQDPKILSRRM